MGKHQETGLYDRLGRSGWFGRAATAVLISGAALLSYGFQSWTVLPAGADGSDASGVVAPVLLETGSPGAAPAVTSSVIPSAAATPVTVVRADPAAIVSFERSPVQTIAKDGTHRLTVASADLKRPSAGFLSAPLEVLSPSSPYGLRVDPFTGVAGEFHWGQDFAAACGTRVYAADAGVVRAVGWHPWGGGNRVEIDHGNGLITTYNHLQGIGVTTGQSVRVGEVIARVGTTGSSTGCHLHFETIVNGLHTNPMNWTLLPIRQVDSLDDIPMVSYAPGSNTPSPTTPVWAVPVVDPSSPSVGGGELERPAPTPTPAATPTGSPTGTPSGSATGTPTPTATPTGSPTGTPSGSATGSPTPTATPTGSPTGTPSGSATGSPTPTATPTATPTGTPSGSATVTPTPTATPTPPTTAPTPAATPTSAVTTAPSAPSPAPTATSGALTPSSPATAPPAPLPAPVVPSATTSASPSGSVEQTTATATASNTK
ncbi:M23 family metallopeptidase [Arthrobacter sp. M4]|uniref:M23 family metallopeptidase n=1 Tax=Arthrobacter sp. M4 TaxID=218160 RepID=UPI001CDBE59E|nr:M23 family metallopeptidase [Arthrobacter sp. M4]MCA4134333.1 M23 family metallopeptidase [Arthrobacter sp. M4]